MFQKFKIIQKNIFFKITLAVLTVGFITFSSCKKTDQEPQENLNVLKIKIGTNTYTWSDIDGTGGVLPKIDTIKLTPNGTFATEITIQDGSVSPAKDYTAEIIAEKDAHLFVYRAISANLTFTDLAKDSKNKNFGQTATAKTTTASSGTLQILLKHDADKSAIDPSKTGETDIEVVFPVVIK
ncbi:MAG: hypothetical protein U5L45_13555 [Saprospiraceae bacterium]|nr:hypothetical protein [Saprospiraceae bacterium]